MQLAILIVLPATVGLMTLATPIMDLLYAKPGAGVAMLWSAAIVLAVGLYQISAGTLQGMGRAMVPMYSLLLGAAIKIVLTYIDLTAMPGMGIRGAALASVVGFAVAAGNNIWQVSRKIGWSWLSVPYHVVKPLCVLQPWQCWCCSAIKGYLPCCTVTDWPHWCLLPLEVVPILWYCWPLAA